jgi:hypothetical protein
MTFGIPKISELMLTEMASSWVSDEIFSEKHITPYRLELVHAVFPAAKLAMQMPRVARVCSAELGIIFELMPLRCKHRSVRAHQPDGNYRILPSFDTFKMLHKDQVISLQRAIDAQRLVKRLRVRPSRS